MLSRNACTQDGAIALPGSKDAKVTKERASREKSQEDQPKDYAAAHLAALMESATELIWSVDLNFRLATFNKAFSDAFARGHGANVAAGMTRRVQLPLEKAAFFPPFYKRALREGPCSAGYRLADGRDLELTFSPMNQDGRTVGVSVIGKDVTRQKSAEEALCRTAEQYREIFEFAPEAIYRVTREGKTLAINPAGAKLLGYDSPGEAIAALNDWGGQVWFDPQERAAFIGIVDHQGEASSGPRQFRRKDGTPFWGIATGRKICGPDGKILHYQGFLKDITRQRVMELDLGAKVRELHVLSEMDNALLRAKTEEELLSEYCRIVVEAAGYRMAWVGFAEEGPEKRIIPVAHYGHEDGYLKLLNNTWADTVRGQGPTGRCIRTGEIAVAKDFAADPTTAPWHENAAKRGYMSCIAIPFRQFEGEMACLTAYGVRISRWSDEERRLMNQVASALGYGITTLRTAVTKSQHQESLRASLDQIILAKAQYQESLRTSLEQTILTKAHYEESLRANLEQTILTKAQYQESLRASLEQTIEVIAETVDQRDPYTAGHQRRVADLCVAIARKLGLSSERTQGLRLAASIHDLGKIGIPAEILVKPSRLTEIQYSLVKEHAQLGYEIVKNVQFPWPIAQMILQHHERLDGSGYPQGLKADEIFLESRILAVADVVEAMSSHRPYRPSMGIDVALDEVLSSSGTLYDPEAVQACVNLFRHEGYQLPPQ
jgi:PAS domain S-box-containing protein